MNDSDESKVIEKTAKVRECDQAFIKTFYLQNMLAAMRQCLDLMKEDQVNNCMHMSHYVLILY